MKLSIRPQPLYSLGLERALETLAELGLTALEIPLDAGDPLFDAGALLEGGAAALRRKLGARGLAISAVSNHRDGQLLLGPHHADTDAIHPGSPAEKVAYAEKRLLDCARLASELEVGILVGFLGCEDAARAVPWPDPEGWRRMQPLFQERVGALLDRFAELGVSFAQEPHPKQMVTSTATALESLELLGHHPRWGFNLDPASLMLADVDPVLFVKELGWRILNVHACDGELLPDARRHGRFAHGTPQRPARGLRFRIPGWGEVPWKRLVSELRLAGYEGYLAVKNQDSIFHPLDGLKKAIAELAPLLPRGAPQTPWW